MTTLAEAVRRTRREIADAESAARQQLLARYVAAYREIDAELLALTRRIEQARAAGEDVHPDWIRRQARWRNLLVSIDTEMARFGQESRLVVANGQLQAVEIGRTGAAVQAEAAGYVVDLGARAPVVPAAQERLVSALAPGSPLADTLGRYGPSVRDVIEQELFTGIVEGRNPREVLRRIRGKVDGPLVESRLAATVRTEMMRSLNGALSEQLPRLGVATKLWVATLSGRTCPACLARHMSEWPVDAEMDSHPMCRCVWSPMPRVVYAETRRFMQTGDAWLRSQPIDVQRAVLGDPDAVAAFRRGEIGLGNFVGVRFDPRWGRSIYAKSGSRVLRERGRRAA